MFTDDNEQDTWLLWFSVSSRKKRTKDGDKGFKMFFQLFIARWKQSIHYPFHIFSPTGKSLRIFVNIKVFLKAWWLFSHKKERSTDVFYSMDESWEYCMSEKGARHKRLYIIWSQLYERYRIDNLVEVESRVLVSRGWEK